MRCHFCEKDTWFANNMLVWTVGRCRPDHVFYWTSAGRYRPRAVCWRCQSVESKNIFPITNNPRRTSNCFRYTSQDVLFETILAAADKFLKRNNLWPAKPQVTRMSPPNLGRVDIRIPIS